MNISLYPAEIRITGGSQACSRCTGHRNIAELTQVIIHTCDPFRTTNYPNREVVGLWEEAGGFELRTFFQ